MGIAGRHEHSVAQLGRDPAPMLPCCTKLELVVEQRDPIRLGNDVARGFDQVHFKQPLCLVQLLTMHTGL